MFGIVLVLYVAGAQLAWGVFGAADIGLAFYPPSGVTLAALVVLPRRSWPAVIAAICAGEIGVDLYHDVDLTVAIGWTAANAIEPLVGAVALGRIAAGRPIDLGSRAGMSWFLVAAVGAGPAAASVVGGLVKATQSDQSWPSAALHWWAGDGLGVLAVGAPILVLSHAVRAVRGPSVLRGTAGVAVGTILTAIASIPVFWRSTLPPSIMTLPILVVVALRYAAVGVATVSIVLAFSANLATADGQGPFAALDISPPNQLAVAQAFLAVTILSAWYLAIETSERASALAREQVQRTARQRAESMQAVGSLSAELLRALSLDQIVDVVDRHSRDALGTSRVTLETLGANQYSAPDGSDPIRRAVHEGRTITLSSSDEITAANPAPRDPSGPARVGARAVVPLPPTSQRRGAVCFAFATPQTFDAEQLAILSAMVDSVTRAIARADRDEEERIVRRLAEVRAATSDRVARAPADAPALVAASIVEGTASAFGADAGVLYAVGADRLRLRHAHGYRTSDIAEWEDLDLTESTPLCDAIRTGTLVALADEHDWYEHYPHLAALHESTGFASTVAVPLVDMDHRPALVLGLSFTNRFAFTEGVIRLLSAAAEHWVSMMVQADLLVREHEIQRRLTTLQELTARLAAARTFADVVSAFVASGPGAFGAFHLWLGIVEASQHTLELLGETSWQRPYAQRYQTRSLDDLSLPATAVIDQRRAMYFGSADALLASFPRLIEATRASGAQALAALPLMVDDEAVGAFVLSYATPWVFDDSERRALETAADLCSQAFERVRLTEREHHAVVALQRAMLGTPDAVPFASAGFCYRPADTEMGLGGDWYDVIALPSGKVGLVVGDVVGHDVTAAAAMGQLRNAMRALATVVDDPAEVVTRLEVFMRNLDAARASTVVYAVFDPFDHTLRYHCAGHVPPLIVTSDGAFFLEEGRGTLLGCSTVARASATITLAPSAMLVFYTDGLVERRRESLDAGLARLVDAGFRLQHRDLDQFCRAIIDAMVDDAPASDDIAVLAFRSQHARFQQTIPADPGALRGLRHDVRDWLESMDAAPDRIDDVLVALGEAATNALEHAYHETPGSVEVHGMIDGRRLVLTVRDHGRWRSGPSPRHGGRGIQMMRAFCSDVEIDTGADGTTTRMVHELDAPRLATAPIVGRAPDLANGDGQRSYPVGADQGRRIPPR